MLNPVVERGENENVFAGWSALSQRSGLRVDLGEHGL
jgi:hypothetical protein